MASRSELVQMAQELDIEYDELDMGELTDKIRTAIDKEFNRKFLVGVNNISHTLLQFMLMEYDYRLYDKKGNETTIGKV